MKIKNTDKYIRCRYCRFVTEDKSASINGWTAYECGNPCSEYHKALINVSPNGDMLSGITWSGCVCGKRRALR